MTKLKPRMNVGSWYLVRGPVVRNKNSFWWCRCKCGKEKWVQQYALAVGKSSQCQQCHLGRPTANPGVKPGAEFGFWTVLKKMYTKTLRNPVMRGRWLCECRCGTKRIITAHNLAHKVTQSCGCRKRALTRRHHEAFSPMIKEAFREEIRGMV